jgi:hypothetical protein
MTKQEYWDSAEPINATMNYESPSDQFVVAIKVP